MVALFSSVRTSNAPTVSVAFRDNLASSRFRATYFESAVSAYRQLGLVSSRRYMFSSTRSAVSRTAGFSII